MLRRWLFYVGVRNDGCTAGASRGGLIPSIRTRSRLPRRRSGRMAPSATGS
nr:MAG TPA: hypothetical protein [Caudoviricetes sp.]